MALNGTWWWGCIPVPFCQCRVGVCARVLWVKTVSFKILYIWLDRVQKKKTIKKQLHKKYKYERDFLTSRHKITLDPLPCRWNQVTHQSFYFSLINAFWFLRFYFFLFFFLELILFLLRAIESVKYYVIILKRHVHKKYPPPKKQTKMKNTKIKQKKKSYLIKNIFKKKIDKFHSM